MNILFLHYIYSRLVYVNESPYMSEIHAKNISLIIIPSYAFNWIEVENNSNYIVKQIRTTKINPKREKYFMIINKNTNNSIIKFKHYKNIGKIFEYPWDIERGIEIYILYKECTISILRDQCSYIDFSAQFLGILVSGIMLCVVFKVVL